MTPLQWQRALAPYIASPRFASYGAFEEKRPVLVDCSLGVNPLGDLHSAEPIAVSPAEYGGYPAGGAHGHKALAEYISGRWSSVSPEEICFGAGSQGTVSSLSRILGGPSALVQGFLPQFVPALLEFATAGARVETFSLAAPDFTPDAGLLAENLRPGVTLVYVDNPNNPTGSLLPLEALEHLAADCAAKGALLLVDEAYGDFVDDGASALNLRRENIICMRSFSKGCGLAGLRIGYIVIRDAALRRCYQELGLHFSSSVLSADIAARLLPGLDLPGMRERLAQLKKDLLDFIGGFRQFRIAPTHASTPIVLLCREGGGNLYNDLMEVGIQTEPGFFFGLEEVDAVRLRAPSPGDFAMFRTQWMKRFS